MTIGMEFNDLWLVPSPKLASVVPVKVLPPCDTSGGSLRILFGAISICTPASWWFKVLSKLGKICYFNFKMLLEEGASEESSISDLQLLRYTWIHLRCLRCILEKVWLMKRSDCSNALLNEMKTIYLGDFNSLWNECTQKYCEFTTARQENLSTTNRCFHKPNQRNQSMWVQKYNLFQK